MQRRVAIWILGAFWTSPSFGIEAIADLIPIYLHLCKLSSRTQLRAYSLPHNHILRLLLESRPLLCNNPYHFLLNSLSSCQQKMIKGIIVDMDNRFNKVFPVFDSYNKEFFSGSWIIDIFPSWLSFHSSNKCSENNPISRLYQLDDLLIISLLSRSLTVDFILFFSFHFYFTFLFFFFFFSIFRTTRVRCYQSRCHISHNSMA